jgi:4-hydroxybenzoate polyprenyltransferase
MAREIVKDAQDVVGDQLIYVKSLPMVVGESKSLKMVIALLLALPIFYVWISILELDTLVQNNSFFKASIPFAIAALLNLIVVFLILVQKKMYLKVYDGLIKLSMLCGVLATFYIAYLYS